MAWDFYSVADRLYQLNNLYMLSNFIYQNRQILLNEVNELAEGKWVEQYGFEIGSNISVSCYENRLVISKDSK